jgi:hypothetical protein
MRGAISPLTNTPSWRDDRLKRQRDYFNLPYIKLMETRSIKQATQMRQMKKAHQILVGIFQGNGLLGSPVRRTGDNIKSFFLRNGYENMD